MMPLLINRVLSLSNLADTMLAKVEYDGHLSADAYLILTVVLAIIVGGLSWCFYRALTATNKNDAEQLPDEV